MSWECRDLAKSEKDDLKEGVARKGNDLVRGPTILSGEGRGTLLRPDEAQPTHQVVETANGDVVTYA